SAVNLCRVVNRALPILHQTRQAFGRRSKYGRVASVKQFAATVKCLSVAIPAALASTSHRRDLGLNFVVVSRSSPCRGEHQRDAPLRWLCMPAVFSFAKGQPMSACRQLSPCRHKILVTVGPPPSSLQRSESSPVARFCTAVCSGTCVASSWR